MTIGTFKWSGRFGGTFTGVRLGVRANVSVITRLAISDTKDGFVFKDSQVVSSISGEAGLASGAITAILSTFNANGVVAQKIVNQLESAKLGDTFFSNTIKTDKLNLSVSIEPSSLTLDAQNFCAAVGLKFSGQ